MKRFTSLLLCITFLFTLSACKDSDVEPSSSLSGNESSLSAEQESSTQSSSGTDDASVSSEESSLPTATEVPKDPLPGAPELDSSNGHLVRFTTAEDFAPFVLNAMETEAFGDGALKLGKDDAHYQAFGSCTSPIVNAEEFSELTISWDATLPLSTSIELEARIRLQSGAADGKEIWSEWYSWGEYAPGVQRTSREQADEAVSIQADVLKAQNAAATAFQVRATLRTSDVSLTPVLRGLFVSTRDSRTASLLANGEVEDDVNWLVTLEAPSISYRQTYEQLGQSASAPCSLTMMLQQKGEEILPEVVALASGDHDIDSLSFSNLSYVTAFAGALGYEAYVGYTDLAGLKREIAAGYPVAILLSYAGDDVEKSELPHIDGASGEWREQLVVLRGFTARNGQLYAVVNDPAAESTGTVRRTYSLEQLMAAWDGRACFLHEKEEGVVSPIEERKLDLRKETDGYRLYNPGSNVLFNYGERSIFAIMTNGKLTAFEQPVHNAYFLLEPDAEARELWVITDLGIVYRAAIPD